ncbi:uncharacterized protein BYT42DRAFT_554442 [Radiomyces spectabilis]|uniref:uncharacterized protein n=1 Tax=Radiomyces spectabilis TaxID=64574 RepID=UPI002220F015|nr:uncharacterized protein BYT42DRAFT_554442 [Radiomyces spectabilis]KAI8390818.1 hypothetical protein BYT42DRAFT_554442 [Radiomyces spectabilis]
MTKAHLRHSKESPGRTSPPSSLQDNSKLLNRATSPPVNYGVKSMGSSSDDLHDFPTGFVPVPTSSKHPSPSGFSRSKFTSSSSAQNPSIRRSWDQHRNYAAPTSDGLSSRTLSPINSPSMTSSATTWSVCDHETRQTNMDFIVPTIKMDERQAKQSNSRAEPSTASSVRHDPSQPIGFFRVIVCGDSRIGKSSFIAALAQALGSKGKEGSGSGEQSPQTAIPPACHLSGNLGQTSGSQVEPCLIQERFISTMPSVTTLAASNRSDDRSTKQRNDAKNICLVDTTGYGAYLSAQDVIDPIAKYIEKQFHATRTVFRSVPHDSATLLSWVHNPYGAHTHIDACLYLTLGRLKKVDIEYLRVIHGLCNIIPIIVKPDSQSAEQELQMRLDMLRELRENNISFFDFGLPLDTLSRRCSESDPNVPPFVISRMESSYPVEDASWMMEKPSVAENIAHLKDIVFHHHIEDLRRSTALKFVQWRAATYKSAASMADRAPDRSRMRSTSMASMHGTYEDRDARRKREASMDHGDRERRSEHANESVPLEQRASSLSPAHKKADQEVQTNYVDSNHKHSIPTPPYTPDSSVTTVTKKGCDRSFSRTVHVGVPSRRKTSEKVLQCFLIIFAFYGLFHVVSLNILPYFGI